MPGDGRLGRRKMWRRASMLVAILIVAGISLFYTLNPNPEIPSITFPFGAHDLCFDRSGKLLMIVHDSVIDVWNVETGNQVATIDARPQQITTLTLDKERALGCFGTDAGEIGIFNTRSFETINRFSIGSERIFRLAVSAKNQVVLARSFGSHSRIVQLPGGLVGNLKWDSVTSMAISGDEELVALNNQLGIAPDELGVRKLDSLNEENDWKILIPGFDRTVEALSFLGQTHLLAVAQPRQLSLWDFDANKEVDRMHFQGIRAMATSDDGITLVIASYPLTLHIVQTNPLRPVRMMEAIAPIEAFKDPTVRTLAISPDTKYLAASCYDFAPNGLPGHGKTKVWRLDRLLQK